ncbi:permease, partial [Pseudomonas sp. NZIPFR-PS5]
MIISIQYLYWLAGVILAITAFMTATDRSNPKRWTTGLFWGLFAIAFLIGEKLPPVWVGVGVIVMAVIAGFGGVGFGQHENLNDRARRESAGRLKNKLFIPALAIPLVTVIGAVLLKNIKFGDVFLLDPANSTFVSLGIGSLVALALACWLTRDTPVQAMRESRRLTEALGWALLLPQMLAMLGLVFNDAGVGKAVAHLATAYINLDFRLVAVMVYV